ncbi:O-methyltransferase [Candidatus Roizmanbacteria bacterium]|nr:O-methyltransferase [Candidatus Roizmanbacteria bacterium]
MALQDVLREIEKEAKTRFLPIIGPEKGEVLVKIIKKYKPERILEVGTCVGYSAILMSRDLPKTGNIVTIEIDPEVARTAQENIIKARAHKKIEIVIGDAIDAIPTLEGPFDLLFLDAAKDKYLNYLKQAESKLSPDAVVVADNAGVFAWEMRNYLRYVRKSGRYKSTTYDLGFDALEVSKKLFT